MNNEILNKNHQFQDRKVEKEEDSFDQEYTSIEPTSSPMRNSVEMQGSLETDITFSPAKKPRKSVSVKQPTPETPDRKKVRRDRRYCG